MLAFHRLAAAALLLAVSIAPAQGQQAQLRQTPGSQITVSQCDPHRHRVGTGHPWIDPYGIWHPGSSFVYSAGYLAITYVNNARVAAKEVDFGLVARNALIAVANDVGTFSPGTPIDHEFIVSPQIFPIGTAFPYCAVLRVKYTDGSEWHNPTPPQEG